VDWYEAYANFAGDEQQVYVFCMRSMASGAGFHCAYLHATQQAFLEAHELAFLWFGGVFRRLRYDNLKSAVKKICTGAAAGGDGTIHRVPLTLGVCGGVLHAGRRA
jgi:transposase